MADPFATGMRNVFTQRVCATVFHQITREEGINLLLETVLKAFHSTSLTGAHYGAAIHLVSTADYVLAQTPSNTAAHAYPLNNSPLIQMGNLLVNDIASNVFAFPTTRGELLSRFGIFSGNINATGIDFYVIHHLLTTYVIRPNSGASETSGST